MVSRKGGMSESWTRWIAFTVAPDNVEPHPLQFRRVRLAMLYPNPASNKTKIDTQKLKKLVIREIMTVDGVSGTFQCEI